jgi:site-specific DNA recombinase
MNTIGNNAIKSNEELRVYGYVRLSRDDDDEKESLNNQKGILMDYAKRNGYNIIEIFEDDNISGMTFDREGILSFKELAFSNKVDILLVKDLSRIGRDRIKSSIFLSEMRIYDVKVISVTENIDNFNENDDLVIGFKQIINEHYAKDISRKIKAGFKQKHREGLVIMPPFGYRKDKNTNQIDIIDECANIVRLIFKLYIEGFGAKKIAQYLTENNFHTPSWYQGQHSGKVYHEGKKWIGKDIWSDRTVTRILENDSYVGVLRNGVATRSIIYKNKNGKNLRKDIPKEEHILHEGFYTPIIDKNTFDLAQQIRSSRSQNNVRASKNSKIHRYAGLILCQNCGASFVAKQRKGEIPYIEYVCNGYHRFGNKVCTPHRVKEIDLDDIVYAQLLILKDVTADNLNRAEKFIKEWNSKQRDYTKKIENIKYKISSLKEEMKDYSRQLAKKLIDDDMFNELTRDANNEIKDYEKQVETLNESKQINENAKNGLVTNLEMLKDITSKKSISNIHIQMYIKNIIISEDEEGLHIDVKLNAPFKHQFMLSNLFTESTSTCEYAYSVIKILEEINQSLKVA